MKKWILTLVLAMGSLNVSAFDITTQGSGKLSYLTNGNACWRACHVGRNNAIAEMGRVAAAQCLTGYTVTSPAKCETPGRDNSFLDHEWGWPVCKCTDTCSGSFVCTNTGATPSFHVNVAAEWRKLRRAWRINAYDIQKSQAMMSEIETPGQLYAAVKGSVQKYKLSAKPFFAAFAEGAVKRVKAPSPEILANQFNPVVPIMKAMARVRRISPSRVIVAGSMLDRVRDIHVFVGGTLLKSITPAGIGHFRVAIEAPILESAKEVEMVSDGESQAILIQ